MTILSFDSLPLWQGLQTNAGEPILAPFEIALDLKGLFRQTTSPEVIAAVTAAYAGESYNHITAPPGASVWADRFGEMQADLCGKDVVDGCRILEIGAGGLFLAEKLCLHHPHKPAEYVIVDPAMHQGSGLAEVIADYFPTNALAGRQFDMILAFNSLEHVPDPESFLKGICENLSPNGRSYICIPDVTNMFLRHDMNVFLHEHISYFTPASLTTLANSVGLRILSMTSSEDILWIVAGRNPQQEEAAPVSEPHLEVALRNMQAAATNKVERIRSVLESGGRIGFHGATNGLNNFLHIFGLSGHSNIFVFDGDVTKAGRYLPTCPNPIRRSDDPSYREFSLIFVSAMTYFEPIKRFAVSHHGMAAESIQALFE